VVNQAAHRRVRLPHNRVVDRPQRHL
jgi:hypothetical protein